MTRASRPFLESPLRQCLLGCCLLVAAAGALFVFQRHAIVAALEQESAALHRLASQRADQHDAHLTALSAIAAAAADDRRDLFLDVAATITRFYPRIDEVQLIPLDPRGEPIGTEPVDPQTAELVRAAAKVHDGKIVLLPHPTRAHHYIMIKRSPNSAAARYGLMLGVDAAKLLGGASPYWSRPGVSLNLSLPDGQPLLAPGQAPKTIRVSRTLDSASQPLILETGVAIRMAEIFPLALTGFTLAAVGLGYTAAISALRQRARTRAAMEQARISALDSRLAHASRVNALGEMASGLAHELTQPLTAILAQAQAGRRMVDRGDMARLATVLDDTVKQARRAATMLERFRNWSRPQQTPGSACDLRDVIENVHALLTPLAASCGTRLTFHIPDNAVLVAADAIEMEQVVFNLMRNAIEATSASDSAGQVTVTLQQDARQAVLEIADNGPGVPEELRRRLFTPFTTTRANGTGLGLALSQRLVERAGGDISLVEGGSGATFRVVLPRRQGLAGATP